MSHGVCCALCTLQAAVASSFNGRPPFADLRFAVYTNAPAQYALFEKGVEPRLTQLKCAKDEMQQTTCNRRRATGGVQQATLQQATLQQALIESPDGATVQKDADPQANN